MTEPTIYELSSQGRIGVRFPESDVPNFEVPQEFKRRDLPLPELSELDVIRHFTHLSSLNYSIDSGLYPLGSCTMKYNPKINESTARIPGFAFTHPLQPENTIQGNLALMYDLQEHLKEISGFQALTLEPAAGAQGEFVGVSIIRAYHRFTNDQKRTKILIPDSAHGTNPATSAMSGFEVIPVPSDSRGNVDLTALRAVCDETTAGLMLTNPNTLGLFDENVLEVVKIVHDAGGLVYGDGANLNALLGITRPGDLGIDIMHFNLHKTFSTPHGGGGPGAGPVGVTSKLADFLPYPVVEKIEEGTDDLAPLYGLVTPKHTIGRVKSFQGQFGVLVRAYTYIRMHGPEGLKKVAEYAVLNANYLLSKVRDHYHLPFDRICMHEFVVEVKFLEALIQKEKVQAFLAFEEELQHINFKEILQGKKQEKVKQLLRDKRVDVISTLTLHLAEYFSNYSFDGNGDEIIKKDKEKDAVKNLTDFMLATPAEINTVFFDALQNYNRNDSIVQQSYFRTKLKEKLGEYKRLF